VELTVKFVDWLIDVSRPKVAVSQFPPMRGMVRAGGSRRNPSALLSTRQPLTSRRVANHAMSHIDPRRSCIRTVAVSQCRRIAAYLPKVALQRAPPVVVAPVAARLHIHLSNRVCWTPLQAVSQPQDGVGPIVCSCNMESLDGTIPNAAQRPHLSASAAAQG